MFTIFLHRYNVLLEFIDNLIFYSNHCFIILLGFLNVFFLCLPQEKFYLQVFIVNFSGPGLFWIGGRDLKKKCSMCQCPVVIFGEDSNATVSTAPCGRHFGAICQIGKFRKLIRSAFTHKLPVDKDSVSTQHSTIKYHIFDSGNT